MSPSCLGYSTCVERVFFQIFDLQSRYKKLHVIAQTGTGLSPKDESLYPYMCHAFGELKHINPDYTVSNLKGQVLHNTPETPSTSGISLTEDEELFKTQKSKTPHKGKGRGKFT